jgi:hypothetical protein
MRPLDSSNILRIAIAIVLTGVLGCAQRESEQLNLRAAANTASKRPPIGLLDLKGNPFDLWPRERSPITVVLFTRSDCPISNRLAPEIRQLYELYHPKGVEFYLVYVDPDEPSEAIRHHLQEYGYPCPGLRDPQHALVAYCRVTTTPEAVVFDRDRTMTYVGRVNNLYEELGRPRAEATTHELADAIESTVQGRPVAIPRAKAIGCPIADLRS